MTGRSVSVEEKVGHTQRAFEALRTELTPQPMRDILASMSEVSGIEQLASYMSLARNVMANDRTAMLCAVLLTTQGARILPTEGMEEQP